MKFVLILVATGLLTMVTSDVTMERLNVVERILAVSLMYTYAIIAWEAAKRWYNLFSSTPHTDFSADVYREVQYVETPRVAVDCPRRGPGVLPARDTGICGRCRGSGSIPPEYGLCPRCNGTGYEPTLSGGTLE